MREKLPRSIVWRILWTDYGTMVLWLGPLIAWITCGLLALTGYAPSGVRQVLPREERTAILLGIPAGLTLLCFPVVMYRIRHIYMTLRNGEDVFAQIKSVRTFIDRVSYVITYEFQGRLLTARGSLHKNRWTQWFHRGKVVHACVDAQNPKRVVVKDFFGLAARPPEDDYPSEIG